MYKALYPFKSTDENALCFDEGTNFTLLDGAKDPHWWLVQNGKGQVGFVPANYLQKDEASVAEVVKSIDRAIAIIHSEAKEAVGGYTNVQRTNLQKLHKHRANVIEEQQDKSHDLTDSQQQSHTNEHLRGGSKIKRNAPTPPDALPTPTNSFPHSASSIPIEKKKQDQVTTNKTYNPNTETLNGDKNASEEPIQFFNPCNSENSSSSQPLSSLTSALNINNENESISNKCSKDTVPFTAKDIHIPSEIGSELVEKLRTSAGLSYKGSIESVHTVLSHVRDKVPELAVHMNKILETLYLQTQNTSVDLTTDDAKRLEYIFEELAKSKDDSQQRSWFLHNDEHIIQEHLEELLSILNGANTDLCKVIIARDHYSAIDTLVVYYQMETRLGLRMLLLQVFGTLCGLTPKIISELLNSVLPCELARDIQTDTQEIQKFCYSSLVLAMIFSQGEPVPLQYYTQLNETFIQYLLDNIEEPPQSDTTGQVPDLLFNVALSFNLHFDIPEDNSIMKVIATKGTAKVLTEKLLLLINRGDDPVRMFEHDPKPANAVLKFLADLYSSTSTSNLLYTNDAKVLVDIILRMVTDLSPGDSLRTEYLSIIELILKNHNYSEHFHRRVELEACFKRIYNEEEPNSSDMDKRIVVQIWKDLPDMFEADCV